MTRFLLDRLLSLVPVLALVLVVIFSLARIIPGDPAVTLLGPGATQEQISALRVQLDLDQPVTQQFIDLHGEHDEDAFSYRLPFLLHHLHGEHDEGAFSFHLPFLHRQHDEDDDLVKQSDDVHVLAYHLLKQQ